MLVVEFFHVMYAPLERRAASIARPAGPSLQKIATPADHNAFYFRLNATLVIKSHLLPLSNNAIRNCFGSIVMILRDAVHGAWLSLTIFRTAFSYAARSFLKRLYASACAGDSGFTSSSSIWMPRRICLMVMAGFQASSSLRIDRQTVPEG